MEWGAGPRASQYLVLGGQGAGHPRRPHGGRRWRTCARWRGRCCVHRVLTNFRAESDNVTADEIVDAAPGAVKGCGARRPWRSSTPRSLARLATLKLRVRAITEGVLTGLHKSPHHGPVGGVRRAQGVRARRRAPPHRLEGLRQVRQVLREAASSRRRTCAPGWWWTARARWATAAAGAALQARVRERARRLARLPARAPGRRRRAGGGHRTGWSRAIPPRAAASHLPPARRDAGGARAGGRDPPRAPRSTTCSSTRRGAAR